MIGNFHMVGQLARDRHEEMIREAVRERAAAAVAGPSLRARVARVLARRGSGTAPSLASGSASTTLSARPLSGAGH